MPLYTLAGRLLFDAATGRAVFVRPPSGTAPAPAPAGTTAGGTGATGATGSTTETTRLALEDGALLADADGAVIVFSAV